MHLCSVSCAQDPSVACGLRADPYDVQHDILQEATPEERKKIVPRVVIVGGKAASAYYMAKKIVKLVNAVGQKVPLPRVPRTAVHLSPTSGPA